MSSPLSVSEARRELSQLVNRAAFTGERTLLCRNGKDVAAIVSPEDLKLLEAMEDEIDLTEARTPWRRPNGAAPCRGRR